MPSKLPRAIAVGVCIRSEEETILTLFNLFAAIRHLFICRNGLKGKGEREKEKSKKIANTYEE